MMMHDQIKIYIMVEHSLSLIHDQRKISGRLTRD